MDTSIHKTFLQMNLHSRKTEGTSASHAMEIIEKNSGLRVMKICSNFFNTDTHLYKIAGNFPFLFYQVRLKTY